MEYFHHMCSPFSTKCLGPVDMDDSYQLTKVVTNQDKLETLEKRTVKNQFCFVVNVELNEWPSVVMQL